MYKSVQISDFSYTEYISDRYIREYKEKMHNAYLEPLKAYLLDGSNEIFSADKIQEKLFPTIKDNDIFLSHAHKNEDEVIKLAIKLERYGLKVFVDSCVWGNVFDLLESIDNAYCKTGKNLYSYKKSSHTAANVYMILNTALHKMIDQSELFIFLGSKTSVTVRDTIDGSKRESVRSPWIYSELMFANQVRRSPKKRLQFLVNESTSDKISMDNALARQVQFDYDKPDLDYSFSQYDFKRWLDTISNSYIEYSNTLFMQNKNNDQIIQAGEILDSFYKEIINIGKPR